MAGGEEREDETVPLNTLSWLAYRQSTSCNKSKLLTGGDQKRDPAVELSKNCKSLAASYK